MGWILNNTLHGATLQTRWGQPGSVSNVLLRQWSLSPTVGDLLTVDTGPNSGAVRLEPCKTYFTGQLLTKKNPRVGRSNRDQCARIPCEISAPLIVRPLSIGHLIRAMAVCLVVPMFYIGSSYMTPLLTHFGLSGYCASIIMLCKRGGARNTIRLLQIPRARMHHSVLDVGAKRGTVCLICVCELSRSSLTFIIA